MPQLTERGISLSADRIRWRHNGQDHQSQFSDIVEIRLLHHSIVLDVADGPLGSFGSCRIQFRDSRELHVFGCSTWGAVDPEAASLYRTFIGDLHLRLGPEARASIRFMCGASGWRYHVTWTLNMIFGLGLGSTLLILFFMPDNPKVDKLSIVFLFVTCIVMFWNVDRIVRSMKPGRYNPEKLPDDLI
jgi:hypothetical protein